MNFAIDRKHRDFFRKHRWIEFEDLLTPNQQEILLNENAQILSKRLKKPVNGILNNPGELLFSVGRDLWRESSKVKKILLGRNLAETVSQLIEIRPLRFGYDQFLPPYRHLHLQNSYSSLLFDNPTLQEMSCIQGVLCGLILGLSKSTDDEISGLEQDQYTFFSPKIGNGVVFAPDMPIPFHELVRQKNSSYILLVYVQSNAVYYRQENDPHLHELKRWGYNFGDKLSEVCNPLVYG